MAKNTSAPLLKLRRLRVKTSVLAAKTTRLCEKSKPEAELQSGGCQTGAVIADAAKSALADETQPGSVAKPTLKRQRTQIRGGFASALVASMKASAGRSDIEFTGVNAAVETGMDMVPLEERAGYPLERPDGSVDPKDWVTPSGQKVVVSFCRSAWLPDSWGQGLKITKATNRSTGTSGGTLHTYVSPEGKVFYHKPAAEAYAGRSFDTKDGLNGQTRLAKLQAQQAIQVARLAIKQVDSSGSQTPQLGVDSDESFFSILSPQERSCLADKETFHFAVVSARRATKIEGIKDIFMVQTQFLEAGVSPTWYVDEASLKDYQALGLTAKIGGKLTAARNMALDDAQALGRVCVQVSDDISAWEYRDGASVTTRDDKEMNAAHAAARRLILSPVAAAQFILAKMRGAPEETKPRLGGVYMLGCCARTFASSPFSRKHFIIGDFFVSDNSDVRFDREMTLKEDYDFTCSHISAHGSVMRCDRMTLNVKHYSNFGGACANRDAKGAEERKNLDILYRKWPRAFRPNPKRKNEVILKWPADDDAKGTQAKPSARKVIHGGVDGPAMKKTSSVASAVTETTVEGAAVSPPKANPPKQVKRVESKIKDGNQNGKSKKTAGRSKKIRLVCHVADVPTAVPTAVAEAPVKAAGVPPPQAGQSKRGKRGASTMIDDEREGGLEKETGTPKMPCDVVSGADSPTTVPTAITQTAVEDAGGPLQQPTPSKRVKRAASQMIEDNKEGASKKLAATPKKPRVASGAADAPSSDTTTPEKTVVAASVLKADGASKKSGRAQRSKVTEVQADAVSGKSEQVPIVQKTVETLRVDPDSTALSALSDEKYPKADLRHYFGRWFSTSRSIQK